MADDMTGIDDAMRDLPEMAGDICTAQLTRRAAGLPHMASEMIASLI
jgi:hypothetical protein